MMRSSFRLRLALLLAALTGLALGGFGLGAWLLIREAKLQRIDAELRSLAERTAAIDRPDARWALIDAELARRLSSGDGSDTPMLVQDGGGATLYASPRWPAALDPARLPWPAVPRAAVRTVAFALPAPAGPLRLAQASDGWQPPADDGRRPPPPLRPPPRADEDDPDAPPPRGDRPGPGPGPRRGEGPPGFGPPRLGPPPQRLGNEPPQRLPPPSTDPLPAGPERAPSGTDADPSTAAPAPAPVPPAVALERMPGERTFWRVAMATTATARVAMAFNERAIDAEMAEVRNAFLLAIVPALLLIALGAWFVATRALKPVHQLEAAIRRVTAQGLDHRLASSAVDREFARLIDVFNAMLERLERSFRQASRFSADAAHELKTPLAILQGELERRIHQAEPGSDNQIALTGILDEVRRLSMIARKLLMLSQADAGRLPLERKRVDLTAMLEELVEDTRLLAPQLRVTSQIPERLRVDADASLIEQVLHNLISNAIKYNTDPGWIHITAARAVNQVVVAVSNASHGIAPGDEQRVFERFYRGDQAHGRAVDGVGLGLSLAREIARAHGGELSLQAGADHRVFLQLVLPRDGSAADRRRVAEGAKPAGAAGTPAAGPAAAAAAARSA